jgi:Fic family protein
MNSGDYVYNWQLPDWPHWRYDLAALARPLAEVHLTQGQLQGRLSHLGVSSRDEATLRALTEDVLKTSEIEGEVLNPEAVRSSLARRLGVDIGGLAPADRHVDGVVEMILDATTNHTQPLTTERLFGWHAALFPTGHSGLSRIRTAAWRNDATGPMQVVSGPIGRRKIHFEAPPADRLSTETDAFLIWFNTDSPEDAVLKAGIAHLWFVTLHPFDDGNGRISRAIGDMALARAERSPQRFYSLSAQIQRERNDYYEFLERTQKDTMDATPWLAWFLGCLLRAQRSAMDALDSTVAKATFWQRWSSVPMNERQIKLLNRLQDGFEGKLTTSKWAAIAKCSPDTALRDINELLLQGVLKKSASGGRSTSYELA